METDVSEESQVPTDSEPFDPTKEPEMVCFRPTDREWRFVGPLITGPRRSWTKTDLMRSILDAHIHLNVRLEKALERLEEYAVRTGITLPREHREKTDLTWVSEAVARLALAQLEHQHDGK